MRQNEIIEFCLKVHIRDIAKTCNIKLFLKACLKLHCVKDLHVVQKFYFKRYKYDSYRLSDGVGLFQQTGTFASNFSLDFLLPPAVITWNKSE